MSVKTILIVFLALVFGVSAAVGVTKLNKRAAPAAAETVPVVVAVEDIRPMTSVSPEMLRTRDYPKHMVPAGALSQVEDALDRVTFVPILKDEPVLEPKVSQKGAGRGLATAIPKGMRAVTIKTPNVASGVAGFILPGNTVDVLFTRQSHGQDDATGGGSTTTLLQGVEIMAVDQQIEAPSNNKVNLKELKSVTLLVTPDQAAQIDLGQTMGTLTLSLRNPHDTAPSRASVATLRSIQFRQGKPWDDRVKSLMDAATKVMADMREAAAKAEKEKAALAAKAEEERVAREAALAASAAKERAARDAEPLPKIRTLRAGIPGRVELD